MSCPCKPNCEHKPAHIKSEGCGPYHDKCDVYEQWRKKHLARKHIQAQKNLTANARIPKANKTVLGTKTYYGG